MFSALHSLTHGTRFLQLTYGLVWLAFLMGLIRMRAPWAKILWSPVHAAFWLLVILAVGGLLGVFVPSFLAKSLGVVALYELLAVVCAYSVGKVGATSNWHGAFTHRRGAVVSRTARRRSANPNGITLAGVPLALDDETKHTKILGTTGTGKSTAIREILTEALGRGDRAIIADPDGGYLARFYDADRGDVILNPFDGDAHKWHLFGEIINRYDVEQLARSLITDGGASDRTWSEYARTLFCAVAHQCIGADNRSDAELYDILVKAPIEELRSMLTSTPAGPFLEQGNERMFGSVRSIVSSAIKPLEYTTGHQGTPLSVRQWVKQGAARSNGGRGGVLFIPYSAGQIAALRSLISAWLRLGIFEAMDCVEGDQRLWFVIDELDALGEIDGLKDALARLRKFGGRCILGFQSIAQVSGTYGRGAAETIVENCANTLILRCSASERGGTSEFASKLIGQREVMHTTSSKTRSPGKWLASTTKSENLRIEPAVMASEIERLPNLEGFLKVASEPDWQRVALTPREPAPMRERKRSALARTAPANATPATELPATAPTPASKPKRPGSKKTPTRRSRDPARTSAPSAIQRPPGEAK